MTISVHCPVTGLPALEKVPMSINRQCRFAGQTDWHSYNNVGFLQAVRQHCADKSDSLGPLSVEVRCESQPDMIDVFTVEGRIEWEIQNPRQGAD